MSSATVREAELCFSAACWNSMEKFQLTLISSNTEVPFQPWGILKQRLSFSFSRFKARRETKCASALVSQVSRSGVLTERQMNLKLMDMVRSFTLCYSLSISAKIITLKRTKSTSLLEMMRYWTHKRFDTQKILFSRFGSDLDLRQDWCPLWPFFVHLWLLHYLKPLDHKTEMF